MREIIDTFKTIYRNDRGVVVWMIILLLFSVLLVVMSLFGLNPSSSMVGVGYTDLGGYRDGRWYYVLAFSGLGLVIGLLHNMIAVKLYKKRGSSMATLFIIISIAVVLLAVAMLMNVLGEL